MQFIIIHGSFVSPNDGWIPKVSRSLINLNQSILTPTFPSDDWDTIIKAGKNAHIGKQNLNSWTKTFEHTVIPKLDHQPPCFVGHSLGPLFSLHIIERYSIQLDSAIFVVPFLRSPHLTEYWQIEKANSTFYKNDFNFEKLKKLIPISYALYSDNDPYIPPNLTLEFCQKLGSLPILIKGGEHLSMDSGWSDIQLVTELCKTRIDAKLYK